MKPLEPRQLLARRGWFDGLRVFVLVGLCLALSGCSVRNAADHSRFAGDTMHAERKRGTSPGVEGSRRTAPRTLHEWWEGAEAGPANWFMNQRRSAGPIPPGARTRAIVQAAQRVAGGSGAWVSVGPFNVGGRVTALGVDPNDSTHLWLGAAAGGVFTSHDSGDSWTPVFDEQAALSIGSLAVHPTNSSVVYVGTGEDNGGGFSYDGEGVFKTTDGGASWTNVGLAAVRRIGRIAIDPTSPERVFVAGGGDWFQRNSDRGIYRSTNGGATWEKVLYVADDAGGIDLAIDPGNPNRVFAAIWRRFSGGSNWYIGGSESGIYRSLDGGTTWTRLTAGLPTMPGRIGLAIAPSNPSIVYACIINMQGRLDGVYRSTNSGDAWVKVFGTQSLFSSFGYYFSQIRVDPADANSVFALDVRLLRSTDGGSSFSTFANSVHVDWHALIIEPGGRWLAGTDGGFFRSANGGGSWFHAASLPITQLYDLGIDRLQPARRFAGAQDNNVLRTTTGGLSDWASVHGGDGLQCEVDYTDSTKVYVESQYGFIVRSVDGGDSFVQAMAGIDPNDPRNWNAPITLDPVNPSTLYTATNRVYRSTDSAESWTVISSGLTNPHPLEHDPPEKQMGPGYFEDGLQDLAHLQNLVDHTITVVSVSPVDNRIIWVGTDDGNVALSTDGGDNFAWAIPPGSTYWVTDIEPDRFEAQKAYLSVTGYRNGVRLPYVRATHDLGATWEDRSGGLPQVPVNTILPSSEWRGRLFAGTDIGVFHSDDDGRTWSFLHDGMPYAVVLDLVENLTSRRLFAATHGRSIYSYDLDQLPPADGDGDGHDNNADCALADAGAFAIPDEVPQLTVETGSILSWSSLAGQAGSGTVYDLAAGSLESLRESGLAASASLACAVAGVSFPDSTPVAPGQGIYYLARARNACGTGSWGRNSQGDERISPACP